MNTTTKTGGLSNVGTATNKKQTVIRPTRKELELGNKLLFYAFNYEHEFVLKAFKGHGSIAQHLQTKFNNYYQRFGNGEQAFLYLWTSLSMSNRTILAGYIDATFS